MGRKILVAAATLGLAAVTLLTTGSASAAGAGDWTQYRGSANHRGWNQAETILSTANVGQLQVVWQAYGGFNSSPAVAGGIVYNGDASLAAYPVNCGTDGSLCRPLWYGGTGYPDWSSPAVVGGMVYMQSLRGLFAFEVGCRSDGGRCDPVWSDPTADAAYTSLAVVGGRLYAAVGSGELRAYDLAACAAQGGVCHPVWRALIDGSHANPSDPMSSPAVSGGVVYIGGRDGYMYAYDTHCATGGGTCSPLWKGYIGVPTVSSPAVANGEVYMPTPNGHMYVFKVGCASHGRTCYPVWSTDMNGKDINGSPAVTNDMVYVPAGRRLYAYPVNCRADGGVCKAAWRSTKIGVGGIIAASPAVANGVVFVSSEGRYQANGRLLAYNAYCTNARHVCSPIWRSDKLGAMVNSSPAISNGMVFVASNNGMFYAFGLPPANP